MPIGSGSSSPWLSDRHALQRRLQRCARRTFVPFPPRARLLKRDRPDEGRLVLAVPPPRSAAQAIPLRARTGHSRQLRQLSRGGRCLGRVGVQAEEREAGADRHADANAPPDTFRRSPVVPPGWVAVQVAGRRRLRLALALRVGFGTLGSFLLRPRPAPAVRDLAAGPPLRPTPPACPRPCRPPPRRRCCRSYGSGSALGAAPAGSRSLSVPDRDRCIAEAE